MSGFVEFWGMVWPGLGHGLLVTLQLSVGALLLGFAVGLPVALIRVYAPKALRTVVTAYIDIFRGTPLLVQLFFIYFGLADPNLNNLLVSLGLPDGLLILDRMTAAYIALGLNSGAYQAEYFRGAIQAIGSGQMIAARALGMTRYQAIVNIVLPQALRLAVAPWSNEAAYMVKYTSIVSLIAVPDLLAEARQVMSRYYNQMVILPFVGAIYLVVVLLVTWVMHRVERRLRIPGVETTTGRV